LFLLQLLLFDPKFSLYRSPGKERVLEGAKSACWWPLRTSTSPPYQHKSPSQISGHATTATRCRNVTVSSGSDLTYATLVTNLRLGLPAAGICYFGFGPVSARFQLTLLTSEAYPSLTFLQLPWTSTVNSAKPGVECGLLL